MGHTSYADTDRSGLGGRHQGTDGTEKEEYGFHAYVGFFVKIQLYINFAICW
tara:strand:+ start:77974 stop:78129 length:156 start_codon:yes stop_codon:yes gene_type:complete